MTHPDPLHPSALHEALAGSDSPWRRVEVVDETGSTNADLMQRAAAGEDVDGVVLFADNQTAGRGRMGRSWSSVPGTQITMSVAIDAGEVPSAAWGWLPLATGVAVVDAVADVARVRAGLKWPNDVITAAGKLAGILTEVATPARAVVIGVGLNVSLQADELPYPEATSLVLLGAEDVDRTRLATALLRKLGERISGWRTAAGADTALMADYAARSLTLGMPVRAMLPGDQAIVGTAVSVDEMGRLCIDTGEATVAVSAGDIVHLRPITEPGTG